MVLSNKIKKINESLTFAISAKIKKMKKRGEDVISFGIGEPDFDTPMDIVEAAKEALDKGYTHYTPASGIPELKDAVKEKFLRDNGLDYYHDQIIITAGAKQALYNLFQVLLNPGDEVIIPVPYWVSYPEMVKMADGIPVFLDTEEENNFKIDLNNLKKSISPKTRAILINTPSNPTGVVYNEQDLKTIATIAVEHDLYIVSDEIYEKVIYDGVKHISIASLGPDVKEKTIVINGMSKAYAMTGWRIGFAAGKKEIIKAMSKIQGHSTSNPNSIAQYASIAGLKGSDKSVQKMVEEFNERRKYIIGKIKEIPELSYIYPQGAFYIMVNISKLIGRKYGDTIIEDSMSFADIMLKAVKVGVLPGKAFGADNYVRISYATSLPEIKKGIERITNFVNELL